VHDVKKMMILVTGFAALIAGAYGSSYLFAQGGGAPAQPQGTKIAVVNIGQVFNEYTRAKALKLELERTLQPYKDKGKKLADEIKDWKAQMQKPGLDPTSAARIQASIKSHERSLEDMSMEIQNQLGKKQEDNLVALWKEVNMGIKAVSEAYGFQIVLGYGDPMEKDLMDKFPNINRKMQAMDLGSSVPLYVHGSVDISPIIVQTLNKWIDDQQKVRPAAGQK
jgi:Skp family chaperone for outer membrane proteins